MLTPKKRPWPVAHIKHKPMTDKELKEWEARHKRNSLSDEEYEAMLLNAVKSGRFNDIWVDENGKPHVGAMPVRDTEQ